MTRLQSTIRVRRRTTTRPRQAGSAPGKQARSWRLAALLGAMLFALAAVSVRVGDIQLIRQRSLAERAEQNALRTMTVRAERGEIRDRYGNLLALDVERESLYVVPELLPEAQRTRLAVTLSAHLGRSVESLLPALSDTSVRWRLVQRGLSPELAQQLRELEEPALRLLYEPQRMYPQGSSAAYILGGLNQNGDGIGGVEAFYDQQLRGTSGFIRAEVDAINVPIPLIPVEEQQAHDGADLVLTLDLPLQELVEQNLAAAIAEQDAEAGIAIVLEVDTGAIRAMASLPAYDPNRYVEYPAERFSQNPAIARLYEPGSTFKIVTVAAGMQSGAFDANTRVPDPGLIERYGWTLANWNGLGNGAITPAEMLYFSSNVAAVHFSDLIGPQNFYRIVRGFEFGLPLGVDLSGEAMGLLPDPAGADWSPLQLATNAFGQGIAVTPLQIVHMAATIGNDGVPVRPHIVEQICHGHRCEAQPIQAGLPVIDAATAQAIRAMLVNSANHYVNPVPPDNLWLIPGYAVAAKTGTSSIPDEQGGYDAEATIGSVVGLLPAQQPRYAILVLIIRPQRDQYGLQTALPVFRSIAERLSRESGLPPDPALVGPGQHIGSLEAGW